MKRIYWENGYITVLPKNIVAKPHKHFMLQLFIKKDKAFDIIIENKKVSGKYILVASDIYHELKTSSNIDFFMLFDESSFIAEELKKKYLRDDVVCTLPLDDIYKEIFEFVEKPDEISYKYFVSSLLKRLSIKQCQEKIYDERIKQVVEILNESKTLDETVEKIAKRIHISSSHLSHLFKKEVGVPLKSYMLLIKLQKAYTYLESGYSITETAQMAGFYSSSHLADVNQKMMGMSISEAKDYFSLD